MKTILLVLAKLALAGFFLYNIGLFSFIGSIDTNSESPPLKKDGGQEDTRYLNEKINRAQNLGRNYSPELYFADLTEIKLKQKRNEFDRSTVIYINGSIELLLRCFRGNLDYNRRHLTDQDYRKLMAQVDVAREKCEDTLEPGSSQRSAESAAELHRPRFWLNLLIDILAWSGNFYLKNFGLGFILLWLWWYQEKDTFRIKNPLSFLICLLLYPLTIARVWNKIIREGARTFALKIEFKRRQVDLFAIISDNELADIKRFAKSNLRLDDYRRYLDNRGLIPRHALMPVLAITICLLIIPRTNVSGANYSGAEKNSCHLEVKAPPGPSFPHANFHSDDNQIVINAIINFNHYIFQTLSSELIRLPLVPEQSPGYVNNPDPVPLSY